MDPQSFKTITFTYSRALPNERKAHVSSDSVRYLTPLDLTYWDVSCRANQSPAQPLSFCESVSVVFVGAAEVMTGLTTFNRSGEGVCPPLWDAASHSSPLSIVLHSATGLSTIQAAQRDLTSPMMKDTKRSKKKRDVCYLKSNPAKIYLHRARQQTVYQRHKLNQMILQLI